MTWRLCEQCGSIRSVTRWRVLTLTLTVALAAVSCARDHDAINEVPEVDAELAALMDDGALPNTMMQPANPTVPPRFCGGTVTPPDADAGMPPEGGSGGKGGPVVTPLPLPSPPSMIASGTAAPSTGRDIAVASRGPAAAGGGAPTGSADPNCAALPIGFWTFDDCNTSRTDLQDSSFQGHTAFRSVDLTCTPGLQGQAVEFASHDDLVYAPDQPDFALDQGMTIAAWVKPDAIDSVRTLFRKRDDATSAFALVINNGKFQFIVRLASGRMVSITAPAKAGEWTHVAASYDQTQLRLYINGTQVSSARAAGVIARGTGPLLMGNDAEGRNFQGQMDSAWFNTLAAPDTTIMQLTCIPRDPIVTTSPMVSQPVTAGTEVTYSVSVMNPNDANCAPAAFFLSVGLPQQDFTANPSFSSLASIASGQALTQPIIVKSGDETEAGSYTLNFQVFAQSGGGISSFPPPLALSDSTATTVVRAVGPIPSDAAATGFVEVDAQYVIAEPTGCHVSSQRELMIRDISVVEDPVRTAFDAPAGNPASGAWSFGRLMQRLSNTDADAPDVTEAMFRTFLTPQVVNTFTIPPRPPMDTLVLQSWPRTSDGKLDLARAPVRLLAIANRLDLNDATQAKAGEGRLVYGVLDSSGNSLQFTIIFEYLLSAPTDAEARAWNDDVHALQTQPFPSESYNQALQVLTDRFSARGAIAGRPNGSAIIDIRTNEIALSEDGQWQLREFHLSDAGQMLPATLFQTPDFSFNNSDVLGRFINENEAAILAEKHEAPLRFEAMPFQAASVFNNIDTWFAPGVTNPDARHEFSLNTCNGCHGGETQTPFLQINPREPGQTSSLSGFLTGEDVADPFTGEQRHLSELSRRRQLLESIVCAPAP